MRTLQQLQGDDDDFHDEHDCKQESVKMRFLQSGPNESSSAPSSRPTALQVGPKNVQGAMIVLETDVAVQNDGRSNSTPTIPADPCDLDDAPLSCAHLQQQKSQGQSLLAHLNLLCLHNLLPCQRNNPEFRMCNFLHQFNSLCSSLNVIGEEGHIKDCLCSFHFSLNGQGLWRLA